MNACLFEQITVNQVVLGTGGAGPVRREEIPGYIAKLFVTGIPDIGVEVAEVRDTLVHASSQIFNAPVDWSSHRVDLEPDWSEEVCASWERGHAKRVSWQSFTGETRRITIRVNLRLFAAVENEARLRGCSLNQFCADALSSQVRTRSKRLERVILEDALSIPDLDGRPTALPQLLAGVSTTIPDCRHAELVDAMKRLARIRYLMLTKWNQGRGFVQYVPDVTDDAEFFYRGDFRLKITDQGRPYLDGLQGAP